MGVFHPSWLCNELVILVAGGFVEGYSVLFNQSVLRLYPRWGRVGELLNNVLYGKAPPRDLTPYTFIVEVARRVFFRVGASPYKIQCHSILCRIHLITISLTESRMFLSTGVPRAFLFSRSICIVASLALGNSTMHLVYYYCFRLKSMPMIA